MNYEQAVKNIRKELLNYITNNNIQSLVLGVSGGIDSTLCALLAKPVCDQLGIPLIGRSLPSKTNTNGENSRAKEIGELFCTEFKETSIQSSYSKLVDLSFDNYEVYPKPNEIKENIRYGNIKARIRMIFLYDLASANNGIVLSTDNYTEYLLGFWTLHGDVGDYGMIQNLWKTEVYNMTEWIRIHELTDEYEQNVVLDVCLANATDGLGISNSDLDQILPGFVGTSIEGYAEVDRILQAYINQGNFGDPSNPVVARHKRTHFKRETPYNIPRNLIINK